MGDLLKLSDDGERFLRLYEEFRLNRIDLSRLKQSAAAKRDDATGQYRENDEGCIIM
jgi:hypothetical protein